MKKGLAPKGMKPAWSLEARKKYETCLAPEIEKYKKAVDKINRNADTTYHENNRDYIVTTFGIGSLSGLFTAAASDVPIGFKFRTETPPKRFLGNKNRVAFWITFGIATYVYIDKRVIALRKEADEFTDATNSFFEKLNDCREKNPYDMWVMLTPAETQTKEFIESLTRLPNNQKLPFQIEFKK